MDDDQVIAKYDDEGPRYQYMTGPDGPQLVDLWFKKSDFQVSARYDPSVHNGYHLFTRKNRLTSQPIPLGATGILQASNFDAAKKTVFLLHGWMNTPIAVFNVHLTAGILYMAESLVYGGFTSSRCDSVASALIGDYNHDEVLKMGGTTPKTGKSVIYYLTTNAVPPFSQG